MNNSVVPLQHPQADQIAPAALVPANMGEAIKLAEMMATAKLVPAALQKSPADCLMVIQQAVRWQMDPFAVAQECSVIQGKLMHSGKLVAAVVNARGNLAERLSFSYTGEGDNRTIKISGRFQGEQQARDVHVRLGDAKTSNKVWQTQPDQQLMYHGTRVWARRHTPELMLGVYSPEEFDETSGPQPSIRDITPSPAAAPLPAPKAAEAPHDPATGEVRPHQIQIGYVQTPEGDKSNWVGWGGSIIAAVKSAASLDDLRAWQDLNQSGLASCAEQAPKAYKSIVGAIDKRRAELTEAKDYIDDTLA